MKINDYIANYNHLFIYDGDTIIFETCRPDDIDIDLFGIEIRNARKVNFSKNDCFEIKSSSKSECRIFTNGKDLYIPATIFELVEKKEKLSTEHYGEKNYKDTYAFKINCQAYKHTKHYEKITDFPSNMPLSEYDPLGKWGSDFSEKFNVYDNCTNFITKEKYICKKWLTYDRVTELTIESDFYTRTEKDAGREERERIAEIMTECCYSNTHISHYEVARILEKLNITIK